MLIQAVKTKIPITKGPDIYSLLVQKLFSLLKRVYCCWEKQPGEMCDLPDAEDSKVCAALFALIIHQLVFLFFENRLEKLNFDQLDPNSSTESSSCVLPGRASPHPGHTCTAVRIRLSTEDFISTVCEWKKNKTSQISEMFYCFLHRVLVCLF